MVVVGNTHLCPVCGLIQNLEVSSSLVIWKSEDVLAFLYHLPVCKGHTLIVPVQHYHGILAVPPSLLSKIWETASFLARHLIQALDAEGVNIYTAQERCAGQLFEHAHIHVIPRWGDDEFFWNWRTLPQTPDELMEVKHRVCRQLEKNQSS